MNEQLQTNKKHNLTEEEMSLPRINANEHECKKDIIFQEEVYQIVGAAMEVSKILGRGFLEPVYQEALEIEFKNKQIPYEAQKKLLIKYGNIVLKKEYIADFFCFEKIIVEIKALNKITSTEESQLLNYLKASNLQLGLIINFGNSKLEWKRLIYEKFA
ncbi:MAG: GxxExxY protein [bacterium]|nr:GxxExxY protein [bacterium]